MGLYRGSAYVVPFFFHGVCRIRLMMYLILQASKGVKGLHRGFHNVVLQ